MRKIWNWIRDYYRLPWFILTAIWVRVFYRKSIASQVNRELAAIRAGSQARTWCHLYGIDKARNLLEARYFGTFRSMDANQAVQAKQLKHDPVELAKYIIRIGWP